MATSPDQSTSLPHLNNSTENYSDTWSHTFDSESCFELRSPNRKDNDGTQLLPPNNAISSVWSIVGGYVVALALAIGHHVFLRYLHGQRIEGFSQPLIKGASNGFATICSICIGFSASSTLIQMKWRVSGSEPLPMYTIDNLFALPAPLVILKTLMRPRRSLLPTILSSILIHAVVLTGILAPTALSIGLSEGVPRDIQVPTFNLSQSIGDFVNPDFTSQDIYHSGSAHSLLHLRIFPPAEQTIKSALLALPDIPWTIPPQCGLKCAFHLTYDAPVLDCEDVILGDYIFASNTPTIVYNASTNLYPPYDASIAPSWLVDSPFDLSVNYTAVSPNQPVAGRHPRAGTYCRFRQGTYNASFELNANNITQRVTTSIISYGDYLSLKYGVEAANVPVFYSGVFPLGWLYNWALCYAFATTFQGTASLFATPDESLQIPEILQNIFNRGHVKDGLIFELAAHNLSETVAGLFSNLTLAFISNRKNSNNTVTVTATVWDGTNIWIYTTWILWGAYLPALLLTAPLALYGLFIIHASGIGMEDTFTSFLLATRNAQLDDVCKEAADFEELQRFRLSYRERGTFLVDSGLRSET